MLLHQTLKRPCNESGVLLVTIPVILTALGDLKWF